MFHKHLESVINRNLKLDIDSVNSSVTIKENSRDLGLKEVTISGLSGNVSCYTLDKPRVRNLYLKKAKPSVNCGCDGMIVISDYIPNTTVIIFCEMKSKNPKSSDYETQLINSHLLIDYISQLVFAYDNCTANIKFAFVLFYLANDRLPRFSIRAGQSKVLTTEKFKTSYAKKKNILKVAFNKTHKNYIHLNDILNEAITA